MRFQHSIALLSWFATAAAGCRAEPLAAPASRSAPALTAGMDVVDGSRVRPFSADYTRTGYLGSASRDLGPGSLRVQAFDDGLHVSIGIVNDGQALHDEVVVDAGTLAPIKRTFPMGDRSVALQYDGATVEQRVTDGEATDTMMVEFAAPGFEPNVLELVLAALPLDAGFQARVAWVNMPDREKIWAGLTVVGRAQIGAAGRDWDTWVCELQAEDGTRRVYWIADEPPYKIRMETHPAEGAKYTDWRLVAVHDADPAGSAPSTSPD